MPTPHPTRARTLSHRASALLAAGVLAVPMTAQPGSARVGAPMSAGSGTASSAQPGALRMDGGAPHERTVFRDGGYLTGPTGRTPQDVVLGYVRAHHGDFGMTAAEADQLDVARVQVTRDGVGRVVLEQRVEGLRVHTANLVGTVAPDGRLVMVSGRSVSSRQASDTARLSGAQAIVVAAERSGVADAALPRQVATDDGVRVYRNDYAQDLAEPSPLTAEQVWFITDDGLRLAWDTDVEAGSQSWYGTVVDAATGRVLERQNRYSHAGPDADVFTGQHPDDSPARQRVDLTGVNGSWVSGTTTNGNNVTAYRDVDNDNTLGEQPSDPDAHFRYAFTDAWRGLPDGTDLVDLPAATVDAALDADLDAITTQLFYYTNDMHDWLWGFGFDEASGNFQTVNPSGSGDDGDAVIAEAQDGFDFGCTSGGNPVRCLNNANFATAGDGSTARMQMYMWARPGRPYRDGSMDGDVIAHEYGHGVSNRLVPGTLSGDTNQAGSLGEGWSDTLSFLRWGDTTVGEYVTGNATSGIRTFPYDSHPWTYGDYSTSVGSPHRNGEIWAAATYQIRERLGIDTTTQLVLDGMRATGNGPTPTFLDARDGILANDMAANGGAHRCALWAAFASRGMGVDAVSNGLHAVPTEDFDTPAECLPSADAGGPYVTAEGTDVQLSAAGSTPGTDASAGDLTTYAWDLDGDGGYDDATGPAVAFTAVGQDGVQSIGLQVSDEWGLTDTDSTTVTVTNVAPTVTISPVAPIDEGGTVTVSGVVTDPGWLDPLTATIDLDDGAGPRPLAGAVENVRPDATLTFSVPYTYGDDGSFTVTVVGSDDDTSTSAARVVVVANLDPVAQIDDSAAEVYGGQSAFVVEAGEPLTVSVRGTDPGSDDLAFRWDWDDSTVTTTTSLVNPPGIDPPKSPSVQPRDVTRDSTHAYADACLYQLEVEVADDDGGAGTDSAAVVITGTSDDRRSTGWWKHQLRGNGHTDLTEAELVCLLQITGYFSTVFDPMTVDQAATVMHDPPKNDERTKFGEVALANWLNFANGAVSFDTTFTPDGKHGTGSTWGAIMAHAEQVRTNPASTQAQLREQRQILQRMLGG